MQGTLYLCATPIGNLEDMTFRAVRILKEVDLIAAEDTRNSIRLLNHFEIHTPMVSYHEYNKFDRGRELVSRLQEGKNVALITDAGMPGISDPGEELVKMCAEAGITVTALPGACACVTALTLSGLGTRRFAFEAFLPADKKERRKVLEELKSETRTIVLYEAPQFVYTCFQSGSRVCSVFNFFCHNSLPPAILRFLLYYCQNVALFYYNVLFSVQLNLCAGVFGVDHFIPYLDFHLYIFCSGANGDYLSLLGFFLCLGSQDDA